MAYPDHWMNELISKNDIVSVVSSYTELKPKGRRLWGLCPVHGEKTASFSVSPDKQLYYCFGCHIGGSVIQFIMDVEHMPFHEAVEHLASRAGMAMPEEVNDAAMQRERAKRERLAEACQLAARFYMQKLLGEQGVAGRAYLKKRGITSDSVKRFGIGYAPNEWEALKRHLGEHGFSPEELVEAGLLVKNADTGRTYDAYRGRVIFPIIAANGRVVGFGARVLNNEEKPKYINTGDTPLYNKRNNLYGLNLQKSGKIADLVMVEGYTDVIGLYESEVTNAVASLGTALTQQQARLLKRYVSNVYIAYDGDAAGQNATIRGLDILMSEGLNVRVIVFPNGQDPDEFVRQNGKEGFDKLKEEALSLNAFKIEAMARNYSMDNENEREQYAVEACRFIATLTPVERERHYQELSRKTGFSLETLRAQGASIRRTDWQQPAKGVRERTFRAERREKQPDSERIRAENALLYHMMQSPVAARIAGERGLDQQFASEGIRQFAEALVAAYQRGEEPNLPLLLCGMQKADAERVSDALKDDAPCVEPEKAVRDCICRIERSGLAEQIEQIKQQLNDPTLSEAQKADYIRTIMTLNQRMRGLS
ncbi:MAG: DNA primase [Christensenella sp.]|nr:DNA primase [Christensenella sp.]